MRMNGLFFGGLFWGALLVLIGTSIIIKSVFNIDLHLGRFFFAAVVILFGISVLTGKNVFKGRVYHEEDRATSVFSSDNFDRGPIEKEYSVIFGKEIIDLREWSPEKDPINININVVFGMAEVLLPRETQTTVKGTTIFGASHFPDGSTQAFGDHTFRKDGAKGGHSLYIETNTIFGNLVAED